MNVSMKNGKVIIDGREFSGRSIQIKNDRVMVDGVMVDGSLSGPINVVIHGDCERLEAIDSVTVTGACGSVRTVSGDVQCGPVSGDVQTVSGDVNCGPVTGNVKTVSGDVRGVK